MVLVPVSEILVKLVFYGSVARGAAASYHSALGFRNQVPSNREIATLSPYLPMDSCPALGDAYRRAVGGVKTRAKCIFLDAVK